jgi:2-aminoethylphosphonate-pyruvate transaminase
VPLTGSGTLAVEAMISSAIPEDRQLLVINNGVYGERMLRMAEAHHIAALELRFSWCERPDLNVIEDTLKKNPRTGAVALVHHETTTGLLNPVAEVAELAQAYGCTFLLDSVSGLGGEEIDLLRDRVDLCACTANKCLQGLPGVSFVLVRKERLEAMLSYPRRSLYMHLPAHWQAHERRSIPFTPSVQAWYALDEALSELLEETVTGRIARYRRAATLLREGFAKLRLEFLLPSAWQANSLTSLHLPPEVTYRELHDHLKEKGFVIYEGQGQLQTSIFRVANMGHLQLADFARFLLALEAVLKRR